MIQFEVDVFNLLTLWTCEKQKDKNETLNNRQEVGEQLK